MTKPVSEPIILIVEDAPDQVHLLTSLVKAEVSDAKIFSCGTLEKAREFLATTKPALMILDLTLPDGKGEELLKEIDAEKSFPVLVVTGNKSEELLSELLGAGADDYIVKPADDLIFQSKLRSMISQRYVSPLSFLGKREGLGRIQFSSEIDILFLNEALIAFIVSIPVITGGDLNLTVGGVSMRVKITSVQPLDEKAGTFQCEAKIPFLTASDALTLRRFIFVSNHPAPKAA